MDKPYRKGLKTPDDMTCTAPGCFRRHDAKGLCKAHNRRRLNGKTGYDLLKPIGSKGRAPKRKMPKIDTKAPFMAQVMSMGK